MFNWNKRIILGSIALSLALFACSSDDSDTVAPLATQNTESGDNSAKTGEVFDLNSVHVNGHAFILSRMDRGSENVYHHFELASKVRMYELDSVTLDTTGVIWRNFMLDTNGNFSFDGVKLHSPYVMIEAAPEKSPLGMDLMVSPRAIIDVRKTNSTGVNMLTYLESFRLRYLVKSGMSFDEAKSQAMREVLDAFGLYDEPLEFDKIDNPHVHEYLNFTGLFFINVFVDSVTTAFSQSGQLGNRDSWSMESFISWAINDLECPDNGYVDYATNFLSALYGFGKCTTELEGVSFETIGGYFHIQCENNQWKTTLQGFQKIEYTTGSMTDNRNGKTYKTVTYNIDGTAQTWMAENLDYGDDVHKEWCLDIKPEDRNLNSVFFENVLPADSSGCSAYGGLYRAYDALMLDTTLFVENALDTCIAQYQKNWTGEGPVVIDTLKVRESCYYTYLDRAKLVAWADSVEAANGHVQGICPDGWHIPTNDEWKTLWKYLDGVVLGDTLLGDPSGFGYKPIVRISESGFVNEKSDAYFAIKPAVFDEEVNPYWFWAQRVHHPYVGYGPGVSTMFVRCIKN